MKNIFWLTILFFLSSCRVPETPSLSTRNLLINNEQVLTNIIVYDIFTPPVSARIYAYTSLAAYEVLRFEDSLAYPSLTDHIKGFLPIPRPLSTLKYNYPLAAFKAFFTVTRKVVFSKDSLKAYESNVYNQFKNSLDDKTYQQSVAFGEAVANVIINRLVDDGYLKSRGKQKHLGSNEPGKWRPTPPDYLDGVEWCWNTMKPMVLDSAAQFKPIPPTPYSLNQSSPFFKMVKETYTITHTLTPEQKLIATYWDDNPFVILHSGHMMFGNKKITPGGHWMGIAAQAAQQTEADGVKTAQTFALTSIALYDAFISCWDEKYRSNYVRPVTVMNENIDKNWVSYLQTPPFPEYTSGHSTISAAASTVLTELYGEPFLFEDSSDFQFIGLKRKFKSFNDAAAEASISRVYGGIHFLPSVRAGEKQGKLVGNAVIKKLYKASR